MPPLAARSTWREAAVPVALFAGTVAYLASLPRTLGASDEGLFLYEAQRLLAGRVLYREMFEIIPPGSFWLMGALFRVFGATIVTAKLFHAVVHASIVVLLFSTLRALGVRLVLSAAVALVQLALFEPAWGDASPHWLSTLLALAVVRVLVPPTTGRAAFAAGLLVGVLAAVQHQKAALTGAGTALFVVVEPLVAGNAAGLFRRLVVLAGGFLLVVVPLVGVLVATAGAYPTYHGLIEHPFLRYRPFHHTAWAAVAPFPGLGAYTSPALLRVLPVLLPLLGVLAAVQGWRGDRGALRRSLLLLVMALTAMASIGYFPDVVHVGYIGVFFLLPLGVLLEAICVWRGLACVLATVVIAAGAWRLSWRWHARWAECRYPTTTPSFGTVDLCDADAHRFVERARALIDASGDRDLFIYPAGAAYYLLTGTVNPTPVQILLPGYSFPEQFDDVIATLESRRIPWVIAFPKMPAGDPIIGYLEQHYRPVDGLDWALRLYRREAP